MSETVEDTRQWCWRKPNRERCEGPFASREDAIWDARHGHEEEGPIEVGRCTYPMDGLALPEADDMLDRVRDALCEIALDADAYIVDKDAADAALREWFERYVVVDMIQWISTDEETVWPDDEEEDERNKP